jgi:uncharacterized membrane protein YebE (DUF533 family)
MSNLLGTLAKVALGVAAIKGAKGVGNMMSQKAAASGGSVVNGGHGGPGAAQANTAGAQPGLGDPLNSVLGGKGQAGGGLGGLLEQLAAAAAAGASAGSSPGATAPASGGGLDTLIRGLADAVSGTTTASKAGAGGSSADALKQSFQKLGEPKVAPTPQQDAAAGLMLRAMLQAAKCDGRIDEGEKKKLIEALGDASPDDMAFVNRELSSPVDVQGLVKQVPKGLEKQIYAVSVMAIDLDRQKEAEYLGELASALGLGPSEVNAMHTQFGIPTLYS